MWINTIDHIQITSPPDVEEEMRFFYNNVLGLPEISKPGVLKPNGGAWYQLGAIQLHVSSEKDAKNYASKRHICFQVHDLSTFQQHLETHRIGIIPDRQPIEGYDRFYLRDPGGNRIEIIASQVKS